ncbi:MAG: hypothetical protein P4M05_35895 [Bradyrhizobium sp.]|nr:hypothetical protein [Bradyrhizobium sp.]
MPGSARLNQTRRINITFPDGNTVLVNLLSEGQYARVLQLPVVRREQDVSGEAEKADAAADFRVPA